MDKENTIKACIVVCSHLSDVQESMGMVSLFGLEDKKQNYNRLNFAKFLLLKYSSNLDVRIDPDEEYEEFKSKWVTK